MRILNSFQKVIKLLFSFPVISVGFSIVLLCMEHININFSVFQIIRRLFLSLAAGVLCEQYSRVIKYLIVIPQRHEYRIRDWIRYVLGHIVLGFGCGGLLQIVLLLPATSGFFIDIKVQLNDFKVVFSHQITTVAIVVLTVYIGFFFLFGNIIFFSSKGKQKSNTGKGFSSTSMGV